MCVDYRVLRATASNINVISRCEWIHKVSHWYCRLSMLTCKQPEYVVVFTKHNRTIAAYRISSEARSVSHVNLCHRHY